MFTIKVNGQIHQVDVDPGTPLLWVIRDVLDLTGTKFGCGISQCGACTIHIDGSPTRSCITPIEAGIDKEIMTVEGLSKPGETLHPIQQAWIEEQVPQCGYCQSGQIMSAVALLSNNPSPSDEEIDQAMSGNICRCGTYTRIKRGIKRAAAELLASTSNTEGITNG